MKFMHMPSVEVLN